MISAFNLEKLKSLLRDFYTLSNIRITVFNDQFQELVAYPPQISRICQIIRTDREAWNSCIRCDREACRIASARHTPYTYRCHAGLTESITPLYAENTVIGYLLFGHILSYPSREEGWQNIRRLCGSYQIDFKELEAACREKPLISEDYISSSSHIMQAVASYLCLERMAVLRQKERTPSGTGARCSRPRRSPCKCNN